MASVLIVGASRGIGFEFARQYRAEGWTVHATVRSPSGRAALEALGAQVHRFDALDEADVAALDEQLGEASFEGVIVNAGVIGSREASTTRPPESDEFALVMGTNVLAPMRLVPALAPRLVPARGTLAFLSSRMGSIGEADATYASTYRVSKAALNMVVRLAHIEFGQQGVRVLALHPGWVRTDMGGKGANIEAATSVTGMRAVIAERKAHPGGTFVDYTGTPVAW